MPPELNEFWNFVLFSTPGGPLLTVGKVIAVLVLLAGGYLVSRLIGYLLGLRLAATRLRPDVVHTIKRVAFLKWPN